MDEQRAADLDTLADLIRQQNEPKTLLGLGAPQPASDEPSAPEIAAPDHPLPDPPPAHEVTSRPGYATITPPPGDDEPLLDLNAALLESNHDDATETPLRTQPRAIGAHPFAQQGRDAVAFEPHLSGARSDAPWAVSPERRVEAALGSRFLLIGLAFAASLAATVALVNSLLPTRKGTLLITASGPNQLRIEQAEVLFDGKTVCSEVPCRLEALAPGMHGVSVWAKGYERMAAQPFEIRGGVQSALQLTLTRRDTAALRVNLNVPGLNVRLDGEDRGAAPTTIHQLSPTEHTLRLAGNPAYAPYEQRITLEADRLLTLEPKLVPLVGKLHLEAGKGAERARVEVRREGEVREITKLPADLELTAGASYRVHASRRGFEDYDAEVTFNEARSNQSLVIALTLRGSGPLGFAAPPPVQAPLAPTPAVPASAALPLPAGATGVLNVTSIPVSHVLLDGRPLGSTPQKLTLSAGPHSLVFVHPTLGRKSLSVSVPAGQSTLATARF